MNQMKTRILFYGVISLLCLTGCNQNSNNHKQKTVISTSENENEEIYSIYLLYKESGGSLSYEEWLATIKGEQGVPGKDGADGKDGIDGSEILTGQGSPSNSLGKEGDIYIDTSSWDLWKKANAGWVKIGNLKGEKGEPGNTGQTGPEGPQGQQGEAGADGTSVRTGNGVPSSNLGDNGDSYIDLSTWNYYVKENGQWILKGNIKGIDGQSGLDGVSVVSVHINNNGDLIVEFSNGETVNAGHMVDTEVYTVRFHVDDEIIATRNVIKGNVVDRPTSIESAGYTIHDWYTKDGEYTTSWNFQGCVVTRDIDLWATFDYNAYSITFIDNVFSNATQTKTVYYDNSFTFPNFKQTGYSVVRWEDADGNAFSNESYRITYNLTLYAVWSANKYKITLNADGGTVSENIINVTYNEEYDLPTPEKNGYTFLGWFDGDNRVSSHATWKLTTNKTYTAKWTNVVMTFTFDAGDGNCDVDTMVILYGEQYELPYPTCDGFDFVAWELNGALIPISGTWSYSSTGGLLVAKWSRNGQFLSVSEDKTKAYYGLYPQEHVNDNNLIKELNKLENREENGWYYYDGYYYDKYTTTYTNDWKFDDTTQIKANCTYWFKCSPIEWKVLSQTNNSFLIISKYALDTSVFYTGNVRVIDGKTIYRSNWKYSLVREYLNTTFLETAFCLGDSSILVSDIANPKRYDDDKYFAGPTSDRIFLPSSSDFSTYNLGKITATDWLRGNGGNAFISNIFYIDKVYYYAHYMTRTHSGDQNIVYMNSERDTLGTASTGSELVIRPMMNVSLF